MGSSIRHVYHSALIAESASLSVKEKFAIQISQAFPHNMGVIYLPAAVVDRAYLHDKSLPLLSGAQGYVHEMPVSVSYFALNPKEKLCSAFSPDYFKLLQAANVIVSDLRKQGCLISYGEHFAVGKDGTPAKQGQIYVAIAHQKPVRAENGDVHSVFNDDQVSQFALYLHQKGLIDFERDGFSLCGPGWSHEHAKRQLKYEVTSSARSQNETSALDI